VCCKSGALQASGGGNRRVNDASAQVLVVGAGPGGLAVSACLRSAGIAFRLVDLHGVPGGAYARAYAHMKLASPARYNVLPGLALESAGEYLTVEAYRHYLHAYAAHHHLEVKRGKVSRLERAATGFNVTFEQSPNTAEYKTEYKHVVVATGMFDFPRSPDVPWLNAVDAPEVLHAAAWRGPEAFRGRRLLIVGAATSAVEIAEECARAGIATTVSARDKIVKLLPQRILGRDNHDYFRLLESLPRFVMRSFCAGTRSLPGTDLGFGEFRRRGLIQVCDALVRVDGNCVAFADGARAQFDAIVLATGYRYEAGFLPAEVSRAPGLGQPLADRCESRSWANLFVVGMPCVRGLNSPFLRGIASDASWIARQISSRIGKRHAR
jgi:putative flavoprotein involved in K+ transport